jgi:hypothetical protein
MAFGEDYQRPATPLERRGSSHGGSPSGYLTDRFGHRQAIHILLSSQALIAKVRSSTRKTKSGPVPFPKSAYPEQTGASMTRSIGYQPRIHKSGGLLDRALRPYIARSTPHQRSPSISKRHFFDQRSFTLLHRPLLCLSISVTKAITLLKHFYDRSHLLCFSISVTREAFTLL